MKKQLKKLILNFKKKAFKSKFNDSFGTKYFYVVGGIVVVTLLIFMFLFNTYKDGLIVDNEGFFISNDSDVLSIKVDNDKKKELKTVDVKAFDTIYKTPLNVYYDSSKKHAINITYPLFSNEGLSLINYNDDINLINSKLVRSSGYKNMIFSYGKAFDTYGGKQIDRNNYILLSYSNGLFINLYDIEITTLNGVYNIPVNSILYFNTNNIKYFELNDKTFVSKEINGIDLDSIVKFYYDDIEEYEYTYEQFLEGTGTSYKKPEPIIIPDEPINPDNPKEDVDPDDEPIEDNPHYEEPDFVYVKPKVKSGEFTSNVYSIDGSIEVEDPSGVIVKEPTYTLRVKGKTYLKRSFYGTSTFKITGLIPDTKYDIIGQYTYLDEDMETKKLVTFYSGVINTKDISSLKAIKIVHESLNKYPKKVEVNNIEITSDLNSEAINGIYKTSIKIDGIDYYLSPSALQALINGDDIDSSTSNSLKSNTDYNYSINFYDRSNNLIPASNTNGSASTSKIAPSVSLKVSSRDVDFVTIKINLKNEDDVDLINYRYEVYDQKGVVIKSDRLDASEVTLRDLDPNQYYTFKVFANIDLNDGNGVVENYEIGNMDFTTVPLTSLGLLNFNVKIEEVNHVKARLSLQINQRKTDVRLVRLTKDLVLNLYDDNGDIVKTMDLSNTFLTSLKNGDSVELNFNNLDSNKTYTFKLKSTSYQGSVSYEADCLTNIDSFETTKVPASVFITNSYTSNTLIDFDVQIIDVDDAIKTNYVRFELRDSAGNITNSSKISINASPVRMTFNNLSEGKQYFAYFYADQYNETNKNETYKTKYLLTRDENDPSKGKPIEFWTTNGISGNVELISSQRIAKGRNLVDMKSNIKWIENQHSGTLHRTYDENGDMHLRSRGAAASYQYDLSEYFGKMVKVSFKAKAINPQSYNIYINNYVTSTTSGNYGYLLEGLSANEFKTFEYTFYLGGYFQSAGKPTNFLSNLSKTYNKYYTSTIGFYINGGTITPTDFVISDFQVYLYDEQVLDYHPEYEMGTWNGSRPVTAAHSTTARNKEVFVAPEDGWYKFEFNNMDEMYKFYYRVYNMEETAVSINLGYYATPVVLSLKKNQKVGFIIQKAGGSLAADIEEMNDNINLKVTRFYGNPNTSTYQEFSYDLVTRIRVNITDARNEINSVDKTTCPECHNYYIRILDKNGNELNMIGYDDLQGLGSLKDVIKEIDLEEGNEYQIELGFKIRDRYYYLDSFDISTKDEVAGVRDANEFRWIQPYGNYVVLNDIDFSGYTYYHGYDYNKFNGTVDFQGYTMSVYSTAVAQLRKFYQTGSSSVLKNLVLDVHVNQTTGLSLEGFVTYNRGLIENVFINVHEERSNVTKDGRFVLLNYYTYQTGKINNFIVNIEDPLDLHDDATLVNFYNRGEISNGYVYGKDINVETELNSGDTTRIVSLVSYYGYVTSKVNHIYTLTSINFPNDYDYDITGLIQRNTYGSIENVYTVGDVNPEKRSNGPIVATLSASGTLKNGYYMSNNTYTSPSHQKIFPLTLRSVEFQKEVLGEDNFNIDEMMEFGYYPHLKWTSTKMPVQPYIELPEEDENEIDIVNSSIVSQSDTSARILLTINNPHGEEITEVVVSDLDVSVDSQNYEEGNSYVYINVSNPRSYKSKYEIRSIKSKYANKYESVRRYNEGDKYLFIDFYQTISSVEEWINIKNDTTSNYSIIADLDFYEYSNYVIPSFTGKIKGNNHTLKNIYIDTNNRGLINNMYGEIRSLNVENFVKTNYASSYNGLFGTTNANSYIDDVHLKNVSITIPDTATSEQLVGALVGYAPNAKISNCSATNVTIISNAEVSNIEVGGLIGRFTTSAMTNCFAQNVDIRISNALYSYGIGGIAGRNSSSEGMIENCYSTGKIVSSTTYVGGITGYANGIVNNSYSTISIISDMDQIGGITGYLYSASYMARNLFAGKVFTDYSGGLIGRISSNINSTSDYPNYAYSGVTLNGKVSSETMDETLISRSELRSREVFEEVISLGNEYDYSELENEILPKLYYSGTTNLLPNQLDNKLIDEGLNIEELTIDKHPSNATLRFVIDNPNSYEITNMEINDVSVDSVTASSIGNNKTLVSVKVTPLRYYDSYRLTKIFYMDNDSEVYADKVYRIDMEFYKELRTVADWQNISKEYAENYRLVNDIDFNGVNPVNTEVFINKLETESENINHSLKNMTINYTANGLYKGLIRKVVKEISNVNFENININNTSTSAQNYTDLININFGLIKNCNFSDVVINAPKKSYVALIGRDEGKGLENLNLNGITVTGSTYIAGLTSYHVNSTGYRTISNIEAENITVTSGNYAGGIIATTAGPSLEEGIYDVNNINIKDSTIVGGNYTGGIAGYGDCSFCSVTNTSVTGATYVGGSLGYGYSSYAYENRIIDSEIGGTKDVGGFIGYGRYIRGAHVKGSTIKGLTASTTNVGGIVGRNESGWSEYRLGITDSTVTNVGNNTGGIIGKAISPTIGYYYVNNSTISGENYVGGVIGHQRQTNEVYGIVGNVNVVAYNSSAGGLIGYVNNAERTSGYFYGNLIEKTNVQARSYAGGFYGKRDLKLNSPNNIYSNYFEGNVDAEDNLTVGLATGDFSDSDIINTRQLAVYEGSTVEGTKVKDLQTSNTEEVITVDDFSEGYINTSTGEVYTNYSYYYATHSDFIPFEAGKTYKIDAKFKKISDGSRDSGGITYTVIYYDENKKILGTGSGANAYVDRYFTGTYITSQSFRALKNGYVRFIVLNSNNVDYIDLTVIDNSYNGLSKKQMVKYDELKSRITWTDYYSSNNVSTYEVSKLSLGTGQFDFAPIKSSVSNLVVTDLSGKNHNGRAYVSGVTEKGFIFDGKNDYIDVSGYEGSKTFTVIATYMHSNTSTSTLFFYGPSSAVNKGYQLSPSTYEPYLTLNGTDYNTYGYQLVMTHGMVALQYDSTNKYIYNYVDGEFKYRRSVNNVPTIDSSYITRIGMTSTGTRPFAGILSNIMVFNRLLSAEEIRQIYASSGITNTEGLELYYDLTKYENTNDGHYPQVKSNDVNYNEDYQELVDFPTNPILLSGNSAFNTGSAFVNQNIYKGSMQGKYHVYRSGIDTVNIEFDEVPNDLKFSYSYGKYNSKEISVKDRVYTISYNFKDDLNINIKTTFENIDKKYKPKELAKMISIIDGNYYYISKGSLYKNKEKVVDNALNIYDDIVLLSSNQLYNLKTQKYQNYIHNFGVSSSKISLYDSSLEDSNIKAYYNFSIISKESEFNIRDYQMVVKDNILYIYDGNNGSNIVFNTYNTNSYQLSLDNNGSIVSYKEDINLGNDFYNEEIVEMTFDKNSSNPIIMIRYEDGNVMAINYYNGEVLFESREYTISLFNYISRSMLSSSGSANINSSSYKENANIIKNINNTKNEKVLEKLGINDIADENASYSNNWTVYYNASSNKYEILRTSNVIDTKVDSNKIVSENSKIESDEFLYNYFHKKVKKNIISDKRLYIYIAIFIIVLINLIVLGRKVLMRNEGNN